MVRTKTYKGEIEPRTFVCKGTFFGQPCPEECEIRIPGIYRLGRTRCVLFNESDTTTRWLLKDGGDE